MLWLTSLSVRLTITHGESRAFVATPPASQPRSKPHFTFLYSFHVHLPVLLINEKSGNGTGSGIHVFIITPGGAVDIPIVEK